MMDHEHVRIQGQSKNDYGKRTIERDACNHDSDTIGIFLDGNEEDTRKKTKLASSNQQQSSAKNKYKGWRVPCPHYQIPTISLQEGVLTPKLFYKEYICQRRPIVLRSHVDGNVENKDNNIHNLQDLKKVLNKWKPNNEHLRKQAGKESVMVEVRSNERDAFGKGNETSMSFEVFLDLLEAGDDMHYLTTQDVEANEDGQPDLMAPFMNKLSSDFPLRPKLMGHLVPQNINIWMGNNKNGTSSGLHHDYHDNFYIVLRGRKRFRLYSPAETEKMYTRGDLHLVHQNGRINYEGALTTAYGADLQADAAAKASKAKDDAEQKLVEAERAVSEGRPDAQKEFERAEELLEEAMEALIDAEFSDDDFNDDSENGEDPIEPLNESDKERRFVDKTVKNPDNFSKIAPHLLDNETELGKHFPEILKTKPAFCELNAGDMLYMPASWFHEVTSFGDKDGHLALNYWFHPPDALDNFEHPYTTDFWSNDFKLRFLKK